MDDDAHVCVECVCIMYVLVHVCTCARLSHARGRRMDGRGDGTAAAASCFAAMSSRIFSVLVRSTDIARVRLALASAKQFLQNQRCFGTLPSSWNLRILTHEAPAAITCTGTHHEEPDFEDHARLVWGLTRLGAVQPLLPHWRSTFSIRYST